MLGALVILAAGGVWYMARDGVSGNLLAENRPPVDSPAVGASGTPPASNQQASGNSPSSPGPVSGGASSAGSPSGSGTSGSGASGQPSSTQPSSNTGSAAGNSGGQNGPGSQQNNPAPRASGSSRIDLLPTDWDEIQNRAKLALAFPTHGYTTADFVAEVAVVNVGLALMCAGEQVTEDEYYALIRRLVRASFAPGGLNEDYSPFGDLRQDSSFDVAKERQKLFAEYMDVAEPLQEAHDNSTITPDMRRELMKLTLFGDLPPQFVADQLDEYRRSGPSADFEVKKFLAQAQASAPKTNSGASTSRPNSTNTYRVGDKVCNATPKWYRVWSGRIVGVNGNGSFQVRIDFSNGNRYSVNSVSTFLESEIQHQQNMSVNEAIGGLKGLFGN